MAKKYRMDTPKGQTQYAFDTKGQDEATKVAEKHNIVATRLARWFREWTKPDRTEIKTTTNPYASHFRFTSAKAAKAAAEEKAKRGGCHPLCFVIGDNGEDDPGRRRYALIARHIAKDFGIEVEFPKFKDKDRVINLTDPRKSGRVVEAGPEISKVRWDDKREEMLSNCYLWLQGSRKSGSPWDSFKRK